MAPVLREVLSAEESAYARIAAAEGRAADKNVHKLRTRSRGQDGARRSRDGALADEG